MADCRTCKYFIPADRVYPEIKKWCIDWISKYRTGEEFLGFCYKRKRPVTYYEGKCSLYTPKKSRRRKVVK